ncbi:MAG TPA: glycoside hydrolase family 9 protein [Streptosporangiaceae bacterium]|nr:glycoside hydrolase family 9 protein [Streptosporangiaceae bacterium]
MRKVMYVQVGIGNGNASDTIQGGYDYWFLPQKEDQMGAKPGDPDYYVEYRPVFEAAPPGQPMSPDLAGRFAADFALGAQLDARTDPGAAKRLLAEAREVYGLAQTKHVSSIVTTFPHDCYPGSEWKSDMLWGAAEIALADEAVPGAAATLHRDLGTAATWARAYIKQGHKAGGDREIRSGSAPSSARPTRRRTRSACTPPTRSTRNTAARTPTARSRSSSSTSRSAATRGAVRSWSGRAAWATSRAWARWRG